MQYIDKPVLKGTERELFFIQSLQDSGLELFFSNEGDYKVKDSVFEIGGKNKHAQAPTYLVKDDIRENP